MDFTVAHPGPSRSSCLKADLSQVQGFVVLSHGLFVGLDGKFY